MSEGNHQTRHAPQCGQHRVWRVGEHMILEELLCDAPYLADFRTRIEDDKTPRGKKDVPGYVQLG